MERNRPSDDRAVQVLVAELPGSEEEAAALLDAYLSTRHERAEETGRAAGSVLTGAPTGAPLAH